MQIGFQSKINNKKKKNKNKKIKKKRIVDSVDPDEDRLIWIYTVYSDTYVLVCHAERVNECSLLGTGNWLSQD